MIIMAREVYCSHGTTSLINVGIERSSHKNLLTAEFHDSARDYNRNLPIPSTKWR